ncbi:hypothetical protein SAMN05445871_2137 [Paraburkholderia caballeronis]|uniref:Uncharacterized protein n=1 Tax=Paraburkholderia caballeronis TaxID=416943 RepID=A0A1H7JU95_9BURK|nr:hypothetical protein C7403_103177 [Paraburkholderia caballeronis]PXX02743.1 hypothetical protein C7407_103177 [Paraburkholderia caballeronis]RAK03468.1 hypothetical protein C7409_103177 [Paraburkholderia caballeronis]SEC39007.1 hypothetical protein SAMN05445871_2137 [Paraburkholderia caballeronis]SEK78092.1 hypothetical protein SAMN05192542_103441 [Paraburkholderia caballeronis]
MSGKGQCKRGHLPLPRNMLLPLEPCRVQVLSLEYHLALSVPCSGRGGMEQVARLARALYLARYRDGAADAGMDAMIFDMARKRAGGRPCARGASGRLVLGRDGRTCCAGGRAGGT